ncbi:unnamed protein product [Rotaria socialis]|uniref:Uncharacterized protein n=1 Tax=Rotaria socialis TaxID=392032 RepID=A0A821SNG2_9BILA|nr:unnamed protein product [Rotaria socialis]
MSTNVHLINETEIFTDKIEPKAAQIKEDFSDFNLNNGEINKTVSEFDYQYNKTISPRAKAEIVKLTEADIIIKLNENIELIVPNNNTEPIIDNVIVELPDIELVQPENTKINLEESLIELKASYNFNLECKNANGINILGNNIGHKAENFKQTGAIVSVKLDEGFKKDNIYK